MPYRQPLVATLAAVPGLSLSVWADFSKAVPESALPCATHQAPTATLGPFCWQTGSIRAAKATGAGVVVLSWNSRSLDLSFALRAARHRGVGTILWGHGFGKRSPWFGDRTRIRTARRADAVLVYGPSMRHRVIEMGIPAERVFAAPNAIDQAAISEAARGWQSRPEDLAAFRREQRLDGPVILYLSRLEPDKHPSLLVEALATVARASPDVTLVLIGDGSARAEVEAAVDRCGVRERVRFAGAVYEEDRIAPWALSASLLVHPGGIGLSLMHAFGYGLPVLTTDRMTLHGPEVEILEEGRNGRFFRHGNADDLAARILGLLGDDERRRAMSAAALATVTGPNGRNIEAMVAGFVEAIDFAAARHGRRREVGTEAPSGR